MKVWSRFHDQTFIVFVDYQSVACHGPYFVPKILSPASPRPGTM